jgi:hypothetical protein
MTLLIDELWPGVVFEQPFRIQKSMSLYHVRPWVYKHGNPPAGEMVLQLMSGEYILREARIGAAAINSAAPLPFAHGPLRFDMNSLQLNHDRTQEFTEFKIRIFMDGYTADANNFYGVIRRYERPFYDIYGVGFNPEEGLIKDTVAPLGFELYKVDY